MAHHNRKNLIPIHRNTLLRGPNCLIPLRQTLALSTYAPPYSEYTELISHAQRGILSTHRTPFISLVNLCWRNYSWLVYRTAFHLVTDKWGNACSYIQSNYAGQLTMQLSIRVFLLLLQVSELEVWIRNKESVIGRQVDIILSHPQRMGVHTPKQRLGFRTW